MGRGLIGGIIWGAVVMGLVLLALALTAPVPERADRPAARETTRPDPAPEAPPSAAAETVPDRQPATSETAPDVPDALPATDPDTAPVDEPSDTTPAAPAAPVPEPPLAAPAAKDSRVPAPETPPATGIELPANSGFSRPEGIESGSLPGEAPAPRARAGAPLAAPVAPASQAPESTETAPMAAPEVVLDGPAPMVPPPDGRSPEPDRADSAVARPETDPAAREPAEPASRTTPDRAPDVAPDAAPDATAEAAPGAIPDAAQDAAPDASPDRAAPAQTGPDRVDPEARRFDPAQAQQPETAPMVVDPAPDAAPGPAPDQAPPPALGLPDTGFGPTGTGMRSDTRSDRLPEIARSAPSAPDVQNAQQPEGTDTAPADAQQPDSPPEPIGALARHAVPFDVSGDAPLMALILIDAGAEGLDLAALLDLSVPVSFAIDPTRPDAAALVQAFRSAGQEVVTLARGLPARATPGDLETAMARLLARTEGSVAILDARSGGFQDDRALSAQMVAIAAETGHGLLTYDRGLNGAARLAGQAGVPAATVFRVLDESGENRHAIRRQLDRALFRARRDGQVVLVGRSYPETVAGLHEWALETPPGEVRLAPVSAILTRR